MTVTPRAHRLTGLSVGKSNRHVYTIDASATAWQARGKCAQPLQPDGSITDPDDWFPELVAGRPAEDRDELPDHETNRSRAEKLCRHCPVIRECFTFAVDERIHYGIYGGLTPAQRARTANANPLYITKGENGS